MSIIVREGYQYTKTRDDKTNYQKSRQVYTQLTASGCSPLKAPKVTSCWLRKDDQIVSVHLHKDSIVASVQLQDRDFPDASEDKLRSVAEKAAQQVAGRL